MRSVTHAMLCTALAICVCAAVDVSAQAAANAVAAEPDPSRPVLIVVPFAPGTGVDIVRFRRAFVGIATSQYLTDRQPQ